MRETTSALVPSMSALVDVDARLEHHLRGVGIAFTRSEQEGGKSTACHGESPMTQALNFGILVSRSKERTFQSAPRSSSNFTTAG
jgi:hypothetical protein